MRIKLDGIALVMLFAAGSMAACAATREATDENDGTEESGRSERGIIGGAQASGYAEAVLVDLKQNGQVVAMCSGSLIAPKVVMTAGHCVHGMTGWNVTAPYANGQKATSTSGTTLDWTTSAETVDPSMHDVGLVFLSAPITIAAYPKLAQSPLAAGSSIVNIGRINNGTLSNTNLYVSKSTTISMGSSQGYPFDYVANEIIESGDSGGPDMQAGTHTIVAVNSGAGGGTEVLARVDLVYSWIQTQIAAHGGNGSMGSGSSSSSSSSSSSAASSSSSSAAATSSSSSGGGNVCAHDVCASGTKLASSCDACATSICSADPYCCQTKWDSQCVSEVGSICGDTCGGGSTSAASSSSSGGGGCGNITYQGTCKGNVLEWCNSGTLAGGNCASEGLSCGWNGSAGYYDCL